MPPFGPRGAPGWHSDRNAGDAFNPVKPLQTFVHNVYVAKDRSIMALALLLVRQIKVTLSTPGRGRFYVSRRTREQGKRRKNGKPIMHRASAPGDPPAVDLGQLRGSIDMERLGYAKARVGTATVYAPALEGGTTRIAPRPFFRPALAAVRRAWDGRIKTDLGGLRP